MENILKDARRLASLIVLLAVLGLLVIILVSWIYISRLQRESVVRKWMEGKLESATRD